MAWHALRGKKKSRVIDSSYQNEGAAHDEVVMVYRGQPEQQPAG
jgi:hypothetical protein